MDTISLPGFLTKIFGTYEMLKPLYKKRIYDQAQLELVDWMAELAKID
ncbi:MAG: hypothetical protein ACFFDT_00240 [Candidatus Hodarchaeota archaeon]